MYPIPTFSQFMKQKSVFARIPWGAISLLIAAIMLFSTMMYTYEQQNALVEAIKVGNLPDGFIEMEIGALVGVMKLMLSLSTALFLGGMVLNSVIEKNNHRSYSEMLRRYDTTTLVKVARSEEMDTVARSMAIGELSRRSPGWSMA